jgi:hypothetical protein
MFLSSDCNIQSLSGKIFREKGDKMEMLIELFHDTFNLIGVILASIPKGLWQFLAFAAAFAAAVGAFLSARATRLATQGQLFLQLLAQYSSETMRKSLLSMSSFKKNS